MKKPLKIGYYSEVKNVGDLLSSFIIENLFNIKTELADWNECELIACGSIIDKVNYNQGNRSVVVWGSGAMWEYHVRENFGMQILATRGKLTAGHFGHSGAIGDPALLLPLIISKSEEPTKDLGIIPHYVDKKRAVKLFGKENIIDVQQDPISFLKDLFQYKRILSSSLHGLIISDAYGIPNHHIKLSDNVLGEDFKFKDYYSIWDKDFESIDLRKKKPNLQDINEKLEKVKIPDTTSIKENLVNSFKNWYNNR